jgi:hypothetical protein
VLKKSKSAPNADELERKAQDSIRAAPASFAIDNVEINVQPRNADWDFEVRAEMKYVRFSALRCEKPGLAQ